MNKDDEITKIDLENRKWKNRRYMAYASLISIFLVTVAVMFILPVSTVTALSQVLSWFYMGMTTIVGAYFGLSTWADIKSKI